MKMALAIALVLATATATGASDDWLGGLGRSCASMGFVAGEVYQSAQDINDVATIARVRQTLTGKCMMDANFVKNLLK